MNGYWYPYGMYSFMRETLITLEKQEERLKMSKTSLVLRNDDVSRSVTLTEANLQAISDFVKNEIEDNGSCDTTDKLVDLMSITDYPVDRDFKVTVVFTVRAADSEAAEDAVHDMINMDGNSDYDIDNVDCCD